MNNFLSERQLQSSSLFWFSHKINRYDKKFLKSSVKRSKEIIILDWDNCTINIVGTLANGKTRLVIRTNTNKKKISYYIVNKPILLRYILNIYFQYISVLASEYYQVRIPAKDPHKNIL